MKKIAQYFALLSLVLLSSLSCAQDSTEVDTEPQCRESFLALTNASISLDGVVVRDFNKSDDQIITNETNSLYSISNYAYTNYVTASLSGTLALDSTMTISYKSVGVDGLDSGNYVMTVIKVDDEESCYWLWNSDSRLGFLLKFY